jgi:hypothetical protein
MNAIAIHYSDATILFDGLTRVMGAKALLYILDDGIKAEKRRQERIRDRKFTENDLQLRNL